MNHYFSREQTAPSNRKIFTYQYKSKSYTFITDTGVFSVGHMDGGTDILLQHIPPLSGSLLDMGCGYGAIGIVLAKEYKLTLTQVDINLRAIELTRENCEKNGVRSNIILSDQFSQNLGQFDTIVINPPIHAGKQVVYSLYEDAFTRLNESGKLYIVVRKKHGAESTITKLTQIFGNTNVLHKKKGVFVLCCEKMSSFSSVSS